MTTIARVTGIENLSGADLRALVDAANAIGTDPDFLATVIGFETAHTFDPAKKNAAGSGATGLIQFMPSTARSLGTTTDELARMSFAEQLGYVVRYFAGWGQSLTTLDKLYLAVFFPAAIYKAPDDVIATEGSAVYEQNRGFDSSGSGAIRRRDVTATIESVLAHAQSLPRVDVPAAEQRWLPTLLVVGTLGLLGGLVGYPGVRGRVTRSFARLTT